MKLRKFLVGVGILALLSIGFLPFAQAQSWWAVSELEVETAFCKQRASLSSDQILAFLGSKMGKTRQDGTIQGIAFESESPWLLELFSQLTSPLTLFGDPKIQASRDLKTEFSIPETCRSVLCAVEAIWGNDRGLRILYLLARYGYNASDLAFQFSEAMELDELEDVIEGVRDMPLKAYPASDLFKPLYRADQDLEKHYSFGACSNAVIMLFSRWAELSPSLRQMVVFHELAHSVSYTEKPTLDATQEWLELGAWHSRRSRGRLPSPTAPTWKTHLDPSHWISGYAGRNPSEDFAESVVAYRYTPARLRSLSPKKYRYIRDRVFQGLEFTSERDCPQD